MTEPGNITITGHAQKTAWDNKTFPPVEQVRDGVWSIPVPFPGNPLRYTLSYLLTGTTGAVVVDPGWDSDDGWNHLLAGLGAAGIGPREVTAIAVTHFHPDHHGMTARLREASGAPVAMGEDERWLFRAADEAAVRADRDQLTFWGVPADRLEEMAVSPAGTSRVPLLPEPDLRLGGGDLLPLAGRTIRTVSTPGHTPGHICLMDEDNALLLSGDHVLPRISPHISLERGGLENPLATYFDSLAALAGCFPAGQADDAVEVLPAHEYRFSGIRQRLAVLDAHNRARSAEVADVLDNGHPHTVWDVAKELTWSRGWDALHGYSLRFALAESASHLVYLRDLGRQIDVETGWLKPDAEPALTGRR